MSDTPKSAYEIVMERLRSKDLETGVEERQLSDGQKATIAEARKVYEARAAERRILHESAIIPRNVKSWRRNIDATWGGSRATATRRSGRPEQEPSTRFHKYSDVSGRLIGRGLARMSRIFTERSVLIRRILENPCPIG